MSTHGTCFTFATSGFGVDRSNSRLSKDRLLRLVSRQTKPNKPTCSSPAPTGVQSSSLSTRSFLLKTGKMRISHRKEKSGDSIASIRQAEAVPIEALWTEGKQVIFEGKPVAVERRHAGTDGKQVVERKQIDVGPSGPFTNIMTVPPKALSTNSTKIDAAKAAEKEMGSNKAGAIFQGLPKTDKTDLSSKDLIDHDFLKRAFGITMEETTGVLEDLPQQKADASTNLTTVLEADKDLFEMDVPLQLAKDRRPELQVSIPSAKVASRSGRLQQETPFTVSPPSTCTPSRQNKPFNGVATARLSIVSPLSVVEMPKPRRPFSAQSLEGMTAETPKSTAPAVKSATSNSSDDISERGTKSSRERSPRSSMSSISSDRPVRPSNEDLSNTTKLAENCGVLASRVSSTNAGAIGHGTVAPNVPKNMRSTPSLRSSPSPIRPSLRDKASYTSIKSTVSSINKNKPLPPEPGVSNTTPINVTNHSPSRSSTMAVRQRMPGSQQSRYNGEAPVASLNASRRSSTRSGTLRSKYTPKDLDALDDAFQRNLPNRTQSTFSYYYNNSTPTLSQVTLALETQLDTIKEDSPNNSLCMPMVNDPLQISRGPMRMEPSRRPPVPTCCAGSPCHDKPETRKRLMKRSASSNHVISQMRSHDSIPRRRASTNVVGSNNKANKILGKTGGYTTPVRMERKGSMDSNWSSGDSPEMYTNTTSPAMSAGGIQTPESELSIIPDAHFEEIRRRLELLSPKEDPSQTFLAFHQRNVSRSHEKLFADIKLVPLPDPRPMEKPKEKWLHEHIMELEAISSPSIAELEDTQQMVEAVEMGLPSPLPMLALPSIEEDSKPSAPQGRKDTLSPDSATQTTKLSAKNRSVNSSQRSVKARSLASLAMSEIPDLYASIPSPPESRIRPSMTAEEVELLISADAAERVLLRILQSLDNLKDLFAAAEVSRGFYRTFKRHELFLIKNALWCMSPAAWELRQMSIPYSELEDGATDYRPNMYLQHYIRDLLTMVKLKAMILDHCKTFLRPETISGLAGETDASPHIDDAFWRVWTFCRIFGCGKGREDDIVGQMDWLKGGVLAKQQSSDTRTLATSDRVAMNSVLFNPPNGFARGNGGGLTAEELYDMTEIWTCLGVLVRGFQGRRQEAREFGIFDGTSITTGDVEEENQALGMSELDRGGKRHYADRHEQRNGHTISSALHLQQFLTSPRQLHQHRQRSPRSAHKAILRGGCLLGALLAPRSSRKPSREFTTRKWHCDDRPNQKHRIPSLHYPKLSLLVLNPPRLRNPTQISRNDTAVPSTQPKSVPRSRTQITKMSPCQKNDP